MQKLSGQEEPVEVPSDEDADYPAELESVEVKDLSHVRWTPKLELQLEETLMNSLFDFSEAAKEFQKQLNEEERASNSNSWYKIDPKTLQLKWTDIEVRKHVIPGIGTSKSEKQPVQANQEVVEERIDTLT